MRPISRVVDVSINTVGKMLIDAGGACAAFHGEKVRGVGAGTGRQSLELRGWKQKERCQHEEARRGRVGDDIDYAEFVKNYGTGPEAGKRYSPPNASASNARTFRCACTCGGSRG